MVFPMIHKNFNYILGIRGLTSSEKGVLHAMVMRSDENNVCFPSIDKLCEDTGIGKTTVVKCVAALAKGGVISLKKRFSKSTIYTISVSPATLVQPVNYCSERHCTSSVSEPTVVQPVKPKSTIESTKKEYNSKTVIFADWYKRILALTQTIGKNNWTQWERLVETYGQVIVEKSIFKVPVGETRWPGVVEIQCQIMKEAQAEDTRIKAIKAYEAELKLDDTIEQEQQNEMVLDFMYAYDDEHSEEIA